MPGNGYCDHAAPDACSACAQRFGDLPAAMHQVEQIEHGDAAVELPHQRHPGRHAARVQLEAQWLKPTGVGARSTSRITNGKTRCTRARPRSRSNLARFSVHGMTGLPHRSTQKLPIPSPKILPLRALLRRLSAVSLRRCCNAASGLLPCDRPFRAYPTLVCICRFQSLGLRKYLKVSLVLRCNVAGLLPVLVNRACQFPSSGLQAGVVDHSSTFFYGRHQRVSHGVRHQASF